MSIGVIALSCAVQAAIVSRQTAITAQVAREKKRLDHLVAMHSKLYHAGGGNGTRKRATAEKWRPYLKIAADVSPMLDNRVE